MGHTKNVAVLAGSLNGAGAERSILTLAGGFVEQGCDVDLVTLRGHADYQVPETIRHVNLEAPSTEEAKQKLGELTSEKHYDLFITSRAELYDAIQARSVVCSVHITPTAWIRAHRFQWLKRILARRKLSRKFQGKRLVALSEGIRDDLLSLGCRADDVSVIPNAFSVDRIRELAAEPQDLPSNHYAVYVASFIKRKRHADLIKAFARLKDTSLDLVLLGKGPEETAIRKMAARLGLEDRVIFMGWHENPYGLIRNAKLSYLVSEAEGLPRVLIESMIIGVPVVSTDCPSGPREVLTGELRPYLVPIGDVDAIADRTERALAQYPVSHLDVDLFKAAHVAERYLTAFN